MPLSASLNVGVSALKSFAEGIQVTSNNISNVNTIGYKMSRAQYSDTFSNLLKPLVPNNANTGVKIPPTQIGGGVQIESVSAVFSQGTIQTSSNNSDLAIAGSGFFMVKDVATGKTMATRAGNFRLDSDGYLVTQQGYRVQGASGANTRIEYNAALGTIDVKGPQDNLSVTAKSLSQELDYITVPSLEGIDVGSVVEGPGITYGTVVTRVDSADDRVYLSKKPTITTTEPANDVQLVLSEGSPYATLAFQDQSSYQSNVKAELDTLTAGQYLGGIGVKPGTVITRVNQASGVATPYYETTAAVTGTSGLPYLTLSTAEAEKLSVGMRVRNGAGAAGSYITDVNVATGQITLSTALTSSPTGAYFFEPTLTLSSPVGDLGTGVKVTPSSTVSAGASQITLSNVSDLRLGMQVVSGKGASGKYITAIDSTTKIVTLSGAFTENVAVTDTFEFSAAPTVWQSNYKFPAVTFSNYYTPALQVGDVRVSFDLDKDYDLVDLTNNSLSGLARAEAAQLAPRIRTFNVGSTGEVSVILSNGQTFKAGYVLLQAFKDPGALIREGSNMFSGVDTAGFFNGPFDVANIENLIPGSRGLGSINGGGLELSNVDLGEEFSNMIVTQRAFQAGSRIISTTDSMMEEVVNLKR